MQSNPFPDTNTGFFLEDTLDEPELETADTRESKETVNASEVESETEVAEVPYEPTIDESRIIRDADYISDCVWNIEH